MGDKIEIGVETFDGILDTLKSLSEKMKKAQIVQGGQSSQGNLTDMHPQDMTAQESRVGPTGMDYIPASQGDPMGKSTDTCENCGGIDKACKSDIGKSGKSGKDGGPPYKEKDKEDDEDDYIEKNKEKEKEKAKKSMDEDMEVQKSSPEEGDEEMADGEEQIMLVNDLVDEVTKSVDLALQAMALRTHYFVKSLENYSLQQVEGLTARLAETSELISKSFGVVEGEDHVPDSAPKSITSADEVAKSQSQDFSHEDVLAMMQKSMTEGNPVITTADITNFEMGGNYRPEVLESIGISVE